ncbi:uncharacterized protein BO97DRAFT_109364 [Aspergillus homomorphus CBS 101889]|uniref:Uncharacterized protein n=1 Tax=Aspergillus homomorphus (strain CBS 101889) TaxID=1450537 RepID=A0A395HTZ7_ASPHC|nr:hypothetical protein BO97DRAFT_109364 [Aspergillus homomorphus CBS 101889]RAL10979.1 hypothetical protein BO97DRAFT_109364 [Aspergillus homomorphus CBS 101889]
MTPGTRFPRVYEGTSRDLEELSGPCWTAAGGILPRICRPVRNCDEWSNEELALVPDSLRDRVGSRQFSCYSMEPRVASQAPQVGRGEASQQARPMWSHNWQGQVANKRCQGGRKEKKVKITRRRKAIESVPDDYLLGWMDPVIIVDRMGAHLFFSYAAKEGTVSQALNRLESMISQSALGLMLVGLV